MRKLSFIKFLKPVNFIFLVFLSVTTYGETCDPNLNYESRLTEKYSESAKYSSQWSKSAFGKKVVILIHGLNNPQTLMDDLQVALDDGQTHFISLSLRGHSGDGDDFVNVKPEDWIGQLSTAYCLGLQYAPAQKIHIIGFSLGGAITLSTLHDRKLQVGSVTLLAPAVELPFFSRLIRASEYLPNDWVIPSMNRREFQVYKGSSVALYRGLNHLYQHFQMNKDEHFAQTQRGLVTFWGWG